MWNLFRFLTVSSGNQVKWSYRTQTAFPFVIFKLDTLSTGIKYKYDASNLHSLNHTLHAFATYPFFSPVSSSPPCPLQEDLLTVFSCIQVITTKQYFKQNWTMDFYSMISIIFYSIFIYLSICFCNCDCTLNRWFHWAVHNNLFFYWMISVTLTIIVHDLFQILSSLCITFHLSTPSFIRHCTAKNFPQPLLYLSDFSNLNYCFHIFWKVWYLGCPTFFPTFLKSYNSFDEAL